MILQKPDATGKSTPFEAEEFRGQEYYPLLSALEDVNQCAVVLFHPVFQTIECKWLSGGEYETLFKIHPYETGLSEKHGITVPIGKLVFGTDDEAACVERLRHEMFEAVQALAFEGRKLPGLTATQETQNFWAKQMDIVSGFGGFRTTNPGKKHEPDFEAYAKRAAARFFIIAKLNEAIRILSSTTLRAARKAAIEG